MFLNQCFIFYIIQFLPALRLWHSCIGVKDLPFISSSTYVAFPILMQVNSFQESTNLEFLRVISV